MPKGDARTDVISGLYVLMLTVDSVRDEKAASTLLEGAECMWYLLADKGCDGDRLTFCFYTLALTKDTTADVR